MHRTRNKRDFLETKFLVSKEKLKIVGIITTICLNFSNKMITKHKSKIYNSIPQNQIITLGSKITKQVTPFNLKNLQYLLHEIDKLWDQDLQQAQSNFMKQKLSIQKILEWFLILPTILSHSHKDSQTFTQTKSPALLN